MKGSAITDRVTPNDNHRKIRVWANIDVDDPDYEAVALGTRRQADLAHAAWRNGLTPESSREGSHFDVWVEGPEEQFVATLRFLKNAVRSLKNAGHGPFYDDVPDEHALERVWRLYGSGEGGENLLYEVEVDPF